MKLAAGQSVVSHFGALPACWLAAYRIGSDQSACARAYCNPCCQSRLSIKLANPQTEHSELLPPKADTPHVAHNTSTESPRWTLARRAMRLCDQQKRWWWPHQTRTLDWAILAL